MKLTDKQLLALISALQEDKRATTAIMSKELSHIIYDELAKVCKGQVPTSEHFQQMEWDDYTINYSHYCQDVMGWPDLQDNGVFEQCVEDAIIRACITYAMDYEYAPTAIVEKLDWASHRLG